MCPECGFNTPNISLLRKHIEARHSAYVRNSNLKEWNLRCYWRAKRGERRINIASVERVLDQFRVRGRRRMLTLRLVAKILSLCLVKIARESE